MTDDSPQTDSATPFDAEIDIDRARRCGYPEVVYGPGKPIASLLGIIETLLTARQPVLITRTDAAQRDAVTERFSQAMINATAGTVRVPIGEDDGDRDDRRGRVAVVSAGTSDRPVAEEAAETLRWMGCGVDLYFDLGVAGPHRLLEKIEPIREADAVVVVAGMEGALPSVVGGHVAVPVIGVPTSVGYGANLGGMSALLGMLNSCAANVTVVNIDAGFKGGYLAGLIARR